MKKNLIIYHLKSLDCAKRKVEIRQKQINEKLRGDKDKTKALNDIRDLLNWYKKQVDYHRLKLIKHLDSGDKND